MGTVAAMPNRQRWMLAWDVFAALYFVGFGAFVAYAAVRAAQKWSAANAQHNSVSTGLFTDLAQAVAGQPGAVILQH